MILPRSITSLLALGLLASPALFADTTATTDPVGMVQVGLPADSDTYVYIPFKRTPEFTGVISTVSAPDANGNTIISFSGTPGFVASQFVYSSGSQPKSYYLLVTTGSKAGMFYSIVANDTATVTVYPSGDMLTTAFVGGASAQVIPFDTLNTIFPAGQGVVASPSISAGNRQTEILIPDHTTAGKDLASNVSYFYTNTTSGAGPGWRNAKSLFAVADDSILWPDSFFIVRNKVGSATSLTFTGTVPMSTQMAPLNVLTGGIDQDNAVVLPISVALTLAQTKLYESGAFAGTSSLNAGLIQDQLLVWDASTVGVHNRAADRSYYYYTGSANNGPGWRKVGDLSTVRDSLVGDSVLGTSAIVIRRKATPSPSTVFWAVKPPYVP